eukprot:gene3992-4346_t
MVVYLSQGKSPEERTLWLSEIAKHCQASEEDVEIERMEERIAHNEACAVVGAFATMQSALLSTRSSEDYGKPAGGLASP